MPDKELTYDQFIANFAKSDKGTQLLNTFAKAAGIDPAMLGKLDETGKKDLVANILSATGFRETALIVSEGKGTPEENIKAAATAFDNTLKSGKDITVKTTLGDKKILGADLKKAYEEYGKDDAFGLFANVEDVKAIQTDLKIANVKENPKKTWLETFKENNQNNFLGQLIDFLEHAFAGMFGKDKNANTRINDNGVKAPEQKEDVPFEITRTRGRHNDDFGAELKTSDKVHRFVGSTGETVYGAIEGVSRGVGHILHRAPGAIWKTGKGLINETFAGGTTQEERQYNREVNNENEFKIDENRDYKKMTATEKEIYNGLLSMAKDGASAGGRALTDDEKKQLDKASDILAPKHKKDDKAENKSLDNVLNYFNGERKPEDLAKLTVDEQKLAKELLEIKGNIAKGFSEQAVANQQKVVTEEQGKGVKSFLDR